MQSILLPQLNLWRESGSNPVEHADFLTQQLITYIGNKRALLAFIGNGLAMIRGRLDKQKLRIF